MRSEIIINLSKLDNNIRAIQSAIKPDTKILAVIKDNAYGHGAKDIADFLSPKVFGFCVATLEEGIELREAGIKNPILIFEVIDTKRNQLYLKYNLTATISDISGFSDLLPNMEYHINFDTGMRRLGIPASQAAKALELMKNNDEARCTGIYTHFASADDPGQKSVHKQLEMFSSLQQIFPDHLLRHTANTGAIFHYTDLDLHFNAVRPGVCLYGYAAGSKPIERLQPILSWKSFVMQVRNIKKGESVGYGETWIAPEDGIVGTIPVGYGDGLKRILGGKIEVSVNGKIVQQVGRISMDYLGIYSENRESFSKNDEVLLLDGEHLNAKIWADLADTISYEITSVINSKIKRSFIS